LKVIKILTVIKENLLNKDVNSIIKVKVNTIKVIKNSLKRAQFSELSKTAQRFRKLDCPSENWTVGSAAYDWN
jgi:hypothetical protein